MLLRKFDAITFLCPLAVTGGPEAIHQVSQILNASGLDSEIAYYGGFGAALKREGQRLECIGPAENPCQAAYAKYNPRPSSGFPLSPNHLVVLPEVRAYEHQAFAPAKVAVWWLSVDNALHPQSHLRDESFRRRYFADESILHFYQSTYAREFLRSAGVRTSFPLGDYTDEAFTAIVPRGPSTSAGIAYNPKKGGALAEAFFAQDASLTPLPLEGYSKQRMVELLRGTPFYIDFGHFPGKDRMPREAAAAGATVFLHRRGSAQFFDDFPVPDFYKFSEQDVRSGRFLDRVHAALNQPEKAWLEQEAFREDVRWEKTVLSQQIAKLMGRR